jgi:5S rRNA maturation endonuclease (ribonuclease M5)
LVRKYVVTDPDFRGGKVAENIGEPLAGEAAAFENKDDELKIVLAVAESLGIKTNYSEREVRLYATSAQKTL